MEENIKTTFKWNANLFGVEIEDKGVHLVVDANPSYSMNWHEAVRFYNNPHRSHTWQLPTIEHLKLVAKYIDEVNPLIRANGGYEIRGWHWAADEYNEFCAWLVHMRDGDTGGSYKDSLDYVRAVFVFQN